MFKHVRTCLECFATVDLVRNPKACPICETFWNDQHPVRQVPPSRLIPLPIYSSEKAVIKPSLLKRVKETNHVSE
jgi:hypothetical protein